MLINLFKAYIQKLSSCYYLWSYLNVVNPGEELFIDYTAYDVDGEVKDVKISDNCNGSYDKNKKHGKLLIILEIAKLQQLQQMIKVQNPESTITVRIKSPTDDVVINSITASSKAVDFGGTVSLFADVLNYNPDYHYHMNGSLIVEHFC